MNYFYDARRVELTNFCNVSELKCLMFTNGSLLSETIAPLICIYQPETDCSAALFRSFSFLFFVLGVGQRLVEELLLYKTEHCC